MTMGASISWVMSAVRGLAEVTVRQTKRSVCGLTGHKLKYSSVPNTAFTQLHTGVICTRCENRLWDETIPVTYGTWKLMKEQALKRAESYLEESMNED